MIWKRLFSIFLLSTVLIAIAAPATIPAEGIYEIAALTGDVQVKRPLWFGYRRAYKGDRLKLTDRIWVKNPQSSATVSCNNLSNWEVAVGTAFKVSEGCSNSGILFRPEDDLAPGRGIENEDLPYLISPRNTALRPNQPLTLRWHAMKEATHYDVTIKYLARPVWEKRVSEPIVDYPDSSQLRRDRDYFIVVTASTGVSSPENPDQESAPTITLLTDEQEQELKKNLAQIETQNLDADAKALGQAHLYHSTCQDQNYPNTCLNQNAIEVLETRIKAGTDNAAIYQLQADMYKRIGLKRQAQQRYRTALALAKKTNNLPLQAEIQEQLGEIAHNLEEFAEAVEWLEAAEAIYQKGLNLEDPEAQGKLEELRKDIEDSRQRI
ncbi:MULTISPECIES: tetratricopeptide repeat protein [unclassified Moorena]|uniref:tetratricopeptide repeat protein n=1 Tax=unclassified Moorena TaxID=2683338 RepID=UPI0013BAFDCC|nr:MULTISPECIES: tetratricopeptide repeat protein [unclassified Moorena]NER87006.1 tetratricopeptide repeat protein [Moorena sp. SIO3A2]NES43554.1 tetratricopeptide repeat protein [Moorena sp. SIO2C4]